MRRYGMSSNVYDFIGPKIPSIIKSRFTEKGKFIRIAMVTSPTRRGVILIGGKDTESEKTFSRHLIELSGDSKEELKWSFLDEKLQHERIGHVAFNITDSCNQVLLENVPNPK